MKEREVNRMRLIDAEAFKAYMRGALEQTRRCYPDGGEWAEAVTEEFCRDIDEQPTVQPERKKGEWLRYGEDGYPNNEDTVFWQCDQCLEQYTGRTKRIPNFCPNCGADMRKENES